MYTPDPRRTTHPGPFIHVPCGHIRGYVDRIRTHPDRPADRYQSCACEQPEVWEGTDVSEKIQLCVLCARGTAGGPSKWAWNACTLCRQQAQQFTPDPAFGVTLPLGRHSIMNQRYVRMSDDATRQELGAQVLLHGFALQDELFRWRTQEVQRIGAALTDDVALRRWQELLPGSRAASHDALERFWATLVAEPRP